MQQCSIGTHLEGYNREVGVWQQLASPPGGLAGGHQLGKSGRGPAVLRITLHLVEAVRSQRDTEAGKYVAAPASQPLLLLFMVVVEIVGGGRCGGILLLLLEYPLNGLPHLQHGGDIIRLHSLEDKFRFRGLP